MKRLLKKLRVHLGQLEHFVADVMYDRAKGARTLPLVTFLRLLSFIFSGIIHTRCWLYQKRIFRSQPLGCFVVVVGNLTVGGTGKTPIVEKLARILQEQNRHVAILTRGYKSKSEPLRRQFWRWLTHAPVPPPKVVSDGKQVLLNSEEAGDEPYMLAKNLPGVVVLVDKDRVRSGSYAIKHFGVDTLILDDGFQYLRLKGRLNVLLIDTTNPFGNGSLLPRGILREPISHLKRSSCIFLTKSQGDTNVNRNIKHIIRKYKPQAEIVECCHKPQYLKAFNGSSILPLSALKGARVAALSGIAMPEGFEEYLRNQGAELVYLRRFLDHHRFNTEELEHFFKRAQEAQANYAVTTEKDAVRIDASFKPSVPFYFLRLEIEILEGLKNFNHAIDRLCLASK